MRRDHLDAVVSQLLIQRIAVIGAIADQVVRLGFDHVESKHSCTQQVGWQVPSESIRRGIIDEEDDDDRETDAW